MKFTIAMVSRSETSRVSIYVGRHRENLPLWQRKLEASTHRRLRGVGESCCPC